jgi:hypothetical protein
MEGQEIGGAMIKKVVDENIQECKSKKKKDKT